MKFMKLFGMGMVSLMLCAGFASCGDDEPKGGTDGGVVLPNYEKRLVKESEQKMNNSWSNKAYIYDANGDLQNEKGYDTDAHGAVTSNVIEYDYSWDSNSCRTIWADKEIMYKFNASDKAISMTMSFEKNKYVYDAMGRLVKISIEDPEVKYTAEINYTWKGLRLISLNMNAKNIYDDSESVSTMNYEFEYEGDKAFGAFVPLYNNDIFGNFSLIKNHPEKFGVFMDEIPSSFKGMKEEKTTYNTKVDNKQSMIVNRNEGVFKFNSISVDADGYLTGVTLDILSDFTVSFYNIDSNGDGKISKDEELQKQEVKGSKDSEKLKYEWENK